MEMIRRFFNGRWAPALCYLGLALLLTWPLILNPSGQVAGGARTDALNSVWGLWFFEQALSNDQIPLQTHLLNHPFGGRLVIADPLNSLLAFPLVKLAGPVAAYAAMVIAQLWGSGLAAHRLGEKLGGNGWVAGVGYVSSALILSHVQNGSSEAVAAAWLPLGLLWLVGAIEQGGLARIFWGGLGLALSTIGSGWYAGIGAFMFATAVALLGWEGVARRQLYQRLIPAMLIGLCLAAPLAIAIKSVAVADDGLVEIKNPDDLSRIRRTLGPADPRILVMPGDFASPDFKHLEGNPSDRFHSAYLGYVLLGLAFWRLYRASSKEAARQPALWLAFGGGLILALGPVVVLNGFPLAIKGHALPLPYALLEPLPGFSALSLLYRLSGISVLILALLADRAHPRWALLVLLEGYLLSPARHLPEITPIPELPAAQALGDAPPGAVLNLPVVPGRNFLYEQVLHHKPIIGSLNTSVNRPGLQILSVARKLRNDTATKEELIAAAQQWQVRYIVSHKNIMAPEAFVGPMVALTRHFTPLAEDERLVVYQLW